MGTWGTNPFESDSVMDFMSMVEMVLNQGLRSEETQTLKHYDKPALYRACVETFLVLYKAGCPLAFNLNEMIDNLKKMLEDEEYLKTWFDEDGFKKDVQRQIKALQNLK